MPVTSLTLPVSTADLHEAVQGGRVRTLAEFVGLLPPEMRRDIALMKSSGCVEGASITRPRVILYSPQARFIASFNSDAAGPAGKVIHLIELADGATFGFYTLDLATARLETAPERCHACHGSPPQPIWGQGAWPGSVDVGSGDVALDDYRVIRGLSQDPDVSGIFSQLPLEYREDLHAVYLTGRRRSYLNDAFGYELSRTTALSLARRVRASPQATVAVLDLFRSYMCPVPDADRLLDEAVVRAGLTAREFYLQFPRTEPYLPRLWQDRGWSGGAAELLSLVQLVLLPRLREAAPAIEPAFSRIEERLQQALYYGYEISEADWAVELTRDRGFDELDPTDEIFPTLFQGDDRFEVCDALDAARAASPDPSWR